MLLITNDGRKLAIRFLKLTLLRMTGLVFFVILNTSEESPADPTVSLKVAV